MFLICFVSEYNMFICYDKQADASVVKRISRLASNQLFQVRVLADAHDDTDGKRHPECG